MHFETDKPAECLLCERGAPKVLDRHDLYFFQGCHCGRYWVEHCDYEDFLQNQRRLSSEERSRLSALLRESTIIGRPPTFLQFRKDKYPDAPSAVARLAEELLSTWPRTVSERLDRTVCNLGRIMRRAGGSATMLTNEPCLTFAETVDEAQAHQNYLLEEHLLAPSDQGIRLTITGWRRFEKLTRGASSQENPAFVAMWFGGADQHDEMNEIYMAGFLAGIEDAGFRSKRADSEEYNDFVMDEILGSIRVAPFVVADFTANRNGVYLEAGFARGLELPVIHTCRGDDFKDAHFDIKQFNTIIWTDAASLRKKLYHRIMSTVGAGPYTERGGNSGPA